VSIRFWQRGFWGCVIVLTLVGATLVPHLRNSAELVRMRNALLLQDAPATGEWTPAAPPLEFRLEAAPVDALYAQAVVEHILVVPGDDWATALRIGQHLLQASGRGGAIQSSLDDTYRRIVERSEGYCGDFVDVFTGLAHAAGLFSRAWAFSFDGFGGHGHVFNEIWDRQAGQWRMIDVFNNFYVADAQGAPLSALAFRAALPAGQSDLQLVRVDAEAPPGFIHEHKAWDYYRRGLPEWYLWMGNNVFEYDQSALVRVFGAAHRALEQLGGIVAGVHPGIRILETADNAAQREAMRWLQVRLLAIVVLSGVALGCLMAWIIAWRRSRNRERSFHQSEG
jgi:hypothetical protein